jgi:hypothetical protein
MRSKIAVLLKRSKRHGAMKKIMKIEKIHCKSRESAELSKSRATRKRSSRSAKRKANQKQKQKQDNYQEPGSYIEAHFRVSLKDFSKILIIIATIVCLALFFQTKDIYWAYAAFILVTGSSIPEFGKTLLPKLKEFLQKRDEVP